MKDIAKGIEYWYKLDPEKRKEAGLKARE